MELEMQWDGNPNIVLDVKTRLGVGLPIQVNIYYCQILTFCLLIISQELCLLFLISPLFDVL